MRIDRSRIGLTLRMLGGVWVMAAVAAVVCGGVYVRKQYRTVMTEITAKAPPPGAREHEGWRSCTACRGRGKRAYYDASGEARFDNCTTCNGTGWIRER
jgi:hypothetical protein